MTLGAGQVKDFGNIDRVVNESNARDALVKLEGTFLLVTRDPKSIFFVVVDIICILGHALFSNHWALIVFLVLVHFFANVSDRVTVHFRHITAGVNTVNVENRG